MNKWIIRAISVYLWWFTVVFALALTASSLPLLQAGSPIGDALIRRPYQWDFELMFTVLFFVWGIFLWKASYNLSDNKSFLMFSAWAFITHALVFWVIGVLNGLKCEILDQQPCIAYPTVDRGGRPRIMIYFRVTFKSLNFTPSDECVELSFFSKEEISRLKFIPALRPLLAFI